MAKQARGARTAGAARRYKSIAVRTWDRFVELVSNPPYRDWAFRGQEQADWPLASTLSRYLKDFGVARERWEDQEARAVRIFKRKASHFLEHVPAREDDFQWLALMQHHGAPTRLLDFTWSPYVAAFFALERARERAAVWALRPPPSVTRIAGPELALEEIRTTGRVFGQRLGIGEPFVMPRRLIAQSGTLVVPGELGVDLDALVGRPRHDVVRFVLPVRSVRAKAMRELYAMNLTYATLFPGLDGLARSMAYELEFRWH